MSTPIPSPINTSDVNQLTVAELQDLINAIRAENNADYLDEDKVLKYINLAIDHLNKRDDFKNLRRLKQYTINTDSRKHYPFTLLFGTEPFERLWEVRLPSDVYAEGVFRPTQDYAIEPDTSGNQGVRFIMGYNGTLEFVYSLFVPKVTSTDDVIDVTHLTNEFFVNKVLQYIFQSEWNLEKVTFYMDLAEREIRMVIANNTYSYDEGMTSHPLF